MARKISFIVTNSGNISAVANGKSYAVAADHSNYANIKQAIIDDNVEDFEKQVNVKTAIEQFTETAKDTVGEITVVDSKVYWKGEELHNALSQKLLMLMGQGFPFEPMKRFMERLLKNPSYRATQELFKFLEHQGLPLTEDGCFLGYKRVRDDYTDMYSGKFDNSVGKVLTMPRNMVDDNWANLCSSGFHVGSIEYVRGFHAGTGHVMLVKVDPADVVSVPSYEDTKLRTCKYEVVAEYDRNLIDPLQNTVYTSQAEPVNSVAGAQCSKDWDDMEEEEEEYEDDEEYDDDEVGENWSRGAQAEIKRLVKLAELKNLNVWKLALKFNLPLEDLSDAPTYKEVISLAGEDYLWSWIEKGIEDMKV